MLKPCETPTSDWRETTAQTLASLTFALAAYGLASAALDVVGLIA